MILYELRCDSDHRFEGWFPQSGAFDEQRAARQLTCPACGSSQIDKAPMAPALSRARSNVTAQVDPLTVLRALRRHVEQNCDPVGTNFAEEARKIHYGEVPEHGIYGEATRDEAEALADEGIEIAALPWVDLADN